MQSIHPCVCATRCEPCLEIDALKARHDQLLYILDGKSFDQDRLKILRAMNKIHDPLILKLPIEIAATIFEFCGFESTLLLGSICHDWRLIAWECPRLWTGLNVRLSSALPFQSRFVRQWLQRSGALPLDICVYEKYYDMAEFPPPTPKSYSHKNALALINVLNRFSDRWRILQLFIPPEYYSHFIGNRKSRSATSLQILDLEPLGICKTTVPSQFVMRKTIPAPSRVVLGSCFGEVSLQSVTIAWTNVTSVELFACKLQDVPLLFREAKNMIKFSLQDIENDSSPSVWLNEHITHDKLQHLHIACGRFQHHLEMLLCWVSLPALRKLYLTENEEDKAPHKYHMEALHQFFVSSPGALRELYLMEGDYDILHLASILTLDRLQSLEILLTSVYIAPWDANNSPDVLFQLLMETHGDGVNSKPSFLPNLQVFGFSPKHGYDLRFNPERGFPWDSFLRCFGNSANANLRSRRPISNIELQFECEPKTALHDYLSLDLETARSLVDLQRQPGLNFVIHAKTCDWDMLSYYRRMFGVDDSPP